MQCLSGFSLLELTSPSWWHRSGGTLGRYAVVGNSGDSSVSVLALNDDRQTQIKTITSLLVVHGIPAPYAVVSCSTAGTVVVTSPSDNSVRLLQIPSGNVLGTVQPGPQPFSAA